MLSASALRRARRAAPSANCRALKDLHHFLGHQPCPDYLTTVVGYCASGAGAVSDAETVRDCWTPQLRCGTSCHAAPMTTLASTVVRALVLAATALSAAPAARAIEEPAFEVLRALNDQVELRRYAPYVVAEVLVPGPAEEAGNQAFPILAGYIFGKNKGERKLQMTAPVTQAPAPVKLPMTAPVTQAPATGGFIVQFVLPRSVTLDTAPQPLDERVMLREVPPSRVAAIRFSGFWSDANYNEHLALLQAALKEPVSRGPATLSTRATTRRSRPGSCGETRSGWRYPSKAGAAFMILSSAAGGRLRLHCSCKNPSDTALVARARALQSRRQRRLHRAVDRARRGRDPCPRGGPAGQRCGPGRRRRSVRAVAGVGARPS